MEFTEICVITDQQHKDIAASVVQMVSSGIYIEDYEDLVKEIAEISHVDIIDEALLKKDRDKVIIHMYLNEFENASERIDFIKEKLKSASCPFDLDVSKIADEDWTNNWKKYYMPFPVGNRLIIKPEWETVKATDGRVILNIEPGLAFGTGMHETTKMCLILLEGAYPEGKNVLDIGCGSGILSIAALLLGALSATAIDIDPLAVKTAKNNAGLNNLTINALEGNLVDRLSSNDRFDIVFANIIADAIIDLLPLIAEHMRENGIFICSGIIDERLRDVLDAIKGTNLSVKKIYREKGWAAIAATG